jgi:asparagine synthase (glutamine-hydrolysing)
MLGIYFTNIGNVESINRKIKNFSSVTYKALNSEVLLIYKNYRKDEVFYCIDDEWLVVDGALYQNDKELTAKVLFHEIKSGQKLDFESLNGEFFISYFIGGNLKFVNDRMGQRQHCIIEKEKLVSIAPTPGAALRLSNLPKVINKEALYFFINSKKLRLNRDTIWQGCKVIEPATLITFQTTGLEKVIYWQLLYSPKNENVSIDELVNIYKKAVNLRVDNKYKKALTLTGGLDSRTMLCAIDEDNLKGIEAITSGMEGCTEVKYAKEVAESVGLPHNPFSLSPEDIFSEKALEYFEDEDIDLVIQSQWYPFLDNMENKDLLLHGLDLDVTIGGIYLTDSLCKLKTKEELSKFINRESFINLQDTQQLFSKEKIEKYHHIVEEAVDKILLECPQENIQEKYDYFILMHSMNRVILQRYRAIRNKLDTVSPMYDIELMNFYLKVPINQRSNYKLFHPFMKQVCGSEASIRYQRTNLPADVPVSFWAKSQFIEKQKEELYREIAKETNGESFVHYNGYYTNVDEWLRFNESWKNAMIELLQSDNSIIVKEWLDKDYINQIVTEHLEHEKSHMSSLMRLMSAEIFLRIGEGWTIKEISNVLRIN